MDFETVTYTLRSRKITQPLSFLALGDLHGAEHGPGNSDIVREAERIKPDLIFFTGDMITARETASFPVAVRLAERLVRIAPVYAVNGNHETGLRYRSSLYRTYGDELRACGVHVVNNRCRMAEINENRIAVCGLEIPFSRYKKFHRNGLDLSEITARLGYGPRPFDASGPYTVLLAHNPQFMEVYFKWGADLVLSGHFHGGVLRLPRGRTLLAPNGFPFPKYGYGEFTENGHTGIVTAGLGEHALPVRFARNNPMEIVHIVVKTA